MSDKAQVTHVEKVTGKDGTTAIYVEGGSETTGKVGGFVDMQTFREAEKRGVRAVREVLERAVETLVQHERERR